MEAIKLHDQNVLEISINVKRQVWDNIEKEILSYIKQYLETLFKEVLKEQIGADRYERTSDRKDYRNGSYHRSLTTKFRRFNFTIFRTILIQR